MSEVPWTQIEQRLLDQVFYAWPAEEVRTAPDLAAAGFIDSLSVVAVLEVLIDATGNEDALTLGTAEDFSSLARIKALHARL